MTYKALQFSPHVESSPSLTAFSVHLPRIFYNAMNCVANDLNNYLFFGPGGLWENVILLQEDMDKIVWVPW